MISKRQGRWKPGESGNPAGRTPGSGQIGKLRVAIAEHVPDIIARLVEAAKSGDVGASRLLLERVIPPVKPVEAVGPLDLAGQSLTDQGRAVLAAASTGALSPSQAAQLLSGLGHLAKLIETDDLTARIAALESKHAEH